MKKELTLEQDILLDAWWQWAYKTKRGYYAGGLSTLESIEWVLRDREILNSLGNFNKKRFKRHGAKQKIMIHKVCTCPVPITAYCHTCGGVVKKKKGIKKVKKIEKLKYLEADSMTDPMTANLWVGNSLIAIKRKVNEIIDKLNE